MAVAEPESHSSQAWNLSVHYISYTYHSVNVTYANPVFVCCCPLRVVFSWLEANIIIIQSYRWNILNPAAINYVHLLITLSNHKCSKLSRLLSHSAKTMQTGKLSQDVECETDCPLVLRFSMCVELYLQSCSLQGKVVKHRTKAEQISSSIFGSVPPYHIPCTSFNIFKVFQPITCCLWDNHIPPSCPLAVVEPDGLPVNFSF